ncbi:MAG: ankyrin repeat domain-containing protein, partial [Rhodobacteraceae bacterium]|nr:ankyrin repeat domain-containing protein [Paracoccaceae bacterium]
MLWALVAAWGSAIASPKTLPRLPIWPTFDYGLGKSVGNREIQKQGPNDELFLWRVDGENSTVYLMGSIHLLKKSSYPLAPLYEYVYDECNQLVVETNESGSDEHNEYLMNKMLLGGNKKLSHYISKSAYNWIQDLAIDNDLPSDFFNQFKPEAVGLFIAQIKAENYGFDLTLGVDFHFIDKAEDDFIPIYSLEGVERYDLFFTGSLAKQADELEDFINEIKKGKAEKELAELVDSWLNDYERMVKFLLENQKKDKKDNDISLKTRNIAWVPEIEKYIKQANVTLVISGAAHFFGDYGVVKLLENKGYKVNQLHDVDIPKVSFSEAIKSDNLTAVKTYIQIHPNLNNYYYDAATPENSAYCPLHTAVKNGKFESVKLLLAAGANINRLTLTQASPIYLAAQEGYLDILKYLFSQGGNIHNTSDDGWSPLHAAAYFSQHLEPIKYLLSVGASIDAKTNAGSTPLYWAIRKGNYDIADYLISNGADLDSKDDAGRTALHKYIKYDRIESAQYILNKGADINAKDNDGFTPIHFAASIEGSVVKITRDEILLENFPNMTLRDFLDSKILFNPLVSQLLSNGANTELTTNRYRMTPLCLAVAIGYYGNAIDLINEGANVNAISSYAGDQVNDEITIGFSPLMLATESDDFKMVKLLAENGADVSYKTGNGKTAHLIAIEEGYLEIAEYLKEKTTQKTIHKAARDNDIISLRKHIAAKTDLDEKGAENWTALHYSAFYGFTEFSEILINNGASIDAKQVDEWTALHFASSRGHLGIVEILIKNGASIGAKQQDEWTALHLAVKNNHLGVVEILINNGASIDAKQKNGW